MRQCFLFEEWRPIPGYEGYYEVSSNGRVRSLDRVRPVGNRHGGTLLRRDKGNVISPCANGNGYVYDSLQRGTGTRQNLYIHRLVAQAFLGNPIGKYDVDHINHDRADNRVENLRWVSHEENIRHSAHLMRHPKQNAKPTNCGERYIRERDGRFILYIRKYAIYKSFDSLDAAVDFRNEVMQRVRNG